MFSSRKRTSTAPSDAPSESKQQRLIDDMHEKSTTKDVQKSAFENGGSLDAMMGKKASKGVAKNTENSLHENTKIPSRKYRILKVNTKSKTSQIRTSRKQRNRLLATRVAIIGAGMAGISAARRLHDAGVQVVVFEARKRVGGRICTISHEDIDGIDLGACWIHGTDRNPVFEACDRFHLSVYSQESDQMKNEILYDMNGQEFNPLLDQWALHTHQKHQAEADEVARQKPLQLVIELSLGSQLEPKLEEAAENNPQKRRLLNWHLANIEYSSGGEVSELGLCAWDQDDLTVLPGDHVMIFEGYSRVVEELTAGLSVHCNSVITKIEYSTEGVALTLHGRETPLEFDYCIVTIPLGVLKASLSVDWENEASFSNFEESHGQPVDLKDLKYTSLLVEEEDVPGNSPLPTLPSPPSPPFLFSCSLTTERGGGPPPASSSLVSQATPPFFSPPPATPSFFAGGVDRKSWVPRFALPSSRNAAAFSTAVKTTTERALRREGCIEFQPPLPEWKCAAISQMPVGCINKVALIFSKIFWDCSKRQIGWASNIRGQYTQIILLHPKPVMIVLLTGRFSKESEERPKIELVNESMAVVSLLTKEKFPPLVAAYVSRWQSDPYARGTYAFLSPGMAGRDYDILSYPVEDRLLFAGEHTIRPYPSTVHGACISGKREGDRIIDWITGKLEKEKVNKWFWGPENVWYSVDLTYIDCQMYYEEDVMVGPSKNDRLGWFSIIKCAFCDRLQTLERPFSGCVVLEDNFNQKRTWAVHADCCYHCPEVCSNNEGSRWYNISKALRRGANIFCAICNSPGATIGCSLSDCNREMHLPCAMEVLGWPNYDENNINKPLFCPMHTKTFKRCLSRIASDDAINTQTVSAMPPPYRDGSEEECEPKGVVWPSLQAQDSMASFSLEKQAMSSLQQNASCLVDYEQYRFNNWTEEMYTKELDQFRYALIPLIQYCRRRWKRNYGFRNAGKNVIYRFNSTSRERDTAELKQFMSPPLCESARLRSIIYKLLYHCKN